MWRTRHSMVSGVVLAGSECSASVAPLVTRATLGLYDLSTLLGGQGQGLGSFFRFYWVRRGWQFETAAPPGAEARGRAAVYMCFCSHDVHTARVTSHKSCFR